MPYYSFQPNAAAETIATADTSHTYDPYYPRAVTMVDGGGTTTYSYVAPGTEGAGELASGRHR